MEKPFTCSTYRKNFSTVGNLRRHNEAFHLTNRTKFQCWHCHSTYTRLETARKHSFNKHGDAERRTVKVSTQNPWWTPEIFKPGPWIPTPETRPKMGTVYNINITAKLDQSQIDKIKKWKMRSRLDPYIGLTVNEALITLTEEQPTTGRLNRLQIMKDLEVSPSSSH